MVLTEEEKAERPFTIMEAADFFKVDRKTVLKWIKEEKLKAFRVGRDWRIARKEIDRLINGG
jgi:excisionase family DNA binding protein